MSRICIRTVVFFLTILTLVLLPTQPAQAANTTVVVSVSIGGGVAIGMVGWLIHITYSERIANSQKPEDTASAAAMFPGQGRGPGFYNAQRPWIDRNQLPMPESDRWGDRSWRPNQAVWVKFLELPW